MQYATRLSESIPPWVAAELNIAQDSTWAEAIAAAIFNLAVQGDLSAAKEIREVTEGKVGDRLEPARSYEPPSLTVHFVTPEDIKATTTAAPDAAASSDGI